MPYRALTIKFDRHLKDFLNFKCLFELQRGSLLTRMRSSLVKPYLACVKFLTT